MAILYILCGMAGVILLCGAFLVICSLFVDKHREYEHDSRFYRFLVTVIDVCLVHGARIRLHVTGLEKLPSDTRKFLIVGNHCSNFDPIVTWYALRKWRPAFLSKDSNFNIPVVGAMVRRCCFLAIDREDPRKAMQTIQKAAAILERGEVSVGVYPEGTRSKDGSLLPFHNGVFKIAQKANAPVAVIALRGTQLVHRNYPLHRTDIYLDVLDVIDAEEVAHSRTAVLGDRVRKLLEQQLSQKTAG